MPIFHVIDGWRSYIAETWIGDIFADDLRSHWNSILKDEKNLLIRRTLVDVRAANLKFTDQELLSAIQSVVIPRLQERDWVVAIVVRDILQFKMSQYYQSYASDFSYDEVFSDAENARAWLLRQELRT